MDFKKNKGFNTNNNDDKVKKINQYFTDVNYGFSVENKNLDRLNELLDNFATNSALQLKITH